MVVYELTNTGRTLAHSLNSSNSPEWRLIHYLRMRGGAAERDNILNSGEISKGELDRAVGKLTHIKPPIIMIAIRG